MKFTCPHCHYQSSVNKPKAGKFKPKCPKCKQPFLLVIHKDGKLQTAKISADPGGSIDSQKSSATQPHIDPDATLSDTDRTQAVEKTTAADDTTVAASVVTQTTGEKTPTDTPPNRSASAAPAPSASEPVAPAEVSQEFDSVGDADFTDPADDPEVVSHEGGSEIPKKLGGYRLEKELGAGGMGTVYLAKQVSLDRDVAVKILKPGLTKNPAFVSRFVREAYAAAQLVHHNVVQIYDIGSQKLSAKEDVHFFGMELVRGDSLNNVIRQRKRIDCETAAGYILQSARGLKFAHDQGMVHRDVKPANLMLNEQGIVKVADLGLVKIGEESGDENVAEALGASPDEYSSQITQVGMSVGTPSYMAPEQWKRSSEVDHRADIYSLGCTFYVMVTGKLPFSGKTPKEVITKIARENAVPPELIVKDIPKRISAIVNKMIAKDPTDRYSDMGALITDLEEFLGITSNEGFSPNEEHVAVLEKNVKAFNENPLAKVRSLAGFGGIVLATILFIGGIFFSPWFSMTVLATSASALLTYFCVRGAMERTHLYTRARDLLFTNQITDWLTMGLSVIVLLVLLYFLLSISGLLIMALVGPLIGIGYYFVIDKVLASKRKGSVNESEELFKMLRLRGMNEDHLRQFVCKYSGKDWEEYFEELFGYKAKLTARNWLKSESGRERNVFRWWRDPVARWIESRFDVREQAKNLRHLESIELQKLLAQGVSKVDAKARAKNIAKLMTENAEAWKQSQVHAQSLATKQSSKTFAGKGSQPTLNSLSRNIDSAAMDYGTKVTLMDRIHGSISLFIGPRTRFLAGILLVGMCLWWMYLNNKVTALQNGPTFMQAVNIVFSDHIPTGEGELMEDKTIPLPLPAPAFVMNGFNSVNHGIMGMFLIYSATVFGWAITFPMIAAVGVAMYGASFGLIPDDGSLYLSAKNIALIAGAVIAMVSIYFLNTEQEGL